MAPKSSPPQPEAAPKLIFDLPPLPPERVALPPPFTGQWVDLALDLPQRDVSASTTNAQLLARTIKGWNLTSNGQPVPVTEEALLALADQVSPLFQWLVNEWVTRRLTPLGAPPTAPSGSSSPPSTT